MAAWATRSLRRRDDDENRAQNGHLDTSGTVYNDDLYEYHGSWWWSDTGLAIRYTIICLIFAVILFYFIGGYWHARRRLKKGLQPLAYHRWMVQRSVRYARPTYMSHYQQDAYQEGYTMHGYVPPPNPPPAYQRDAPPAYEPPRGASKAMADQSYRAPTVEGQGIGESSTQVAPGGRH